MNLDVTSPQYMVYEALQCVCSQNTVLLKSAEVKLSEWEVQPGFYTTIVRLMFSHNDVDVNVRWMATVYFKNGINKYWRRNAPNGIDPNEKVEIKRTLLAQSFQEPIPQIAVQLAVLIGNIARIDYPREWSELMPRLNETISSSNELEKHRSLLILQHVIKALASKRLPSDRRVFQTLTKDIYSCVLQLWNQYTQMYFQNLNENNITDMTILHIEKALLTLRTMRKLTIQGVQTPACFEPCTAFIDSVIPCLKQLLECRLRVMQLVANSGTTSASAQQLIELTEKFILKLMKLLNEYLDSHTPAFLNLVPIALEFSFNYVFYTGAQMIFDNQNQINFPNFAIHCINLMKNIATKASEETDAPIRTTAKNEFFTVERLSYISEKIITYYFLLTPQDLELWDDDPEQYACDEGGESWKYDLRPCTESFYLTLFSQYRQDMIPDLLKLIQKAQSLTLHAGSDMKDLFLKDAIYKAVGLPAFNLFDELDFDEWFKRQLADELKLKGNNLRIIRRRVIWLIGQWTGVKFDRTLRPKVYELCLELLKSDEDMCVRLASSKTLMNALSDFEFQSTQFVPYLEPTFSLIFSLLKEAKECDTKMAVLNIMSLIIDKMTGNIEQINAESLCQYLPLLWDESNDHNMLRCAILSTLHQMVVAFGVVPDTLAPFLYPVIAFSTNKEDPSHIYLLEEGLELWLVVLQNSDSINQELLQLSSNILPIIETSSEYIRTCFSIIQAYILLNSDIYLQQYGKDLIKTCAYLLTDMRSEGIVMIMRLFQSCLRAKPQYAVELLRPVLPDIFKKVSDNGEWQTVMTEYLTIVARTLILDPMVFTQVLQEINVPNPLDVILDVWLTKMQLIVQSDKTKLMSLALSSLLTVQNDSVYKRFDVLMETICEALNDIMKEDNDDPNVMVDSLILTDETTLETNGLWKMEDFEYNTLQYGRCVELCLNDPVHTIVLKSYVESQLTQMRAQLGDERFYTLVATLEEGVLKNLADHNIVLKPTV